METRTTQKTIFDISQSRFPQLTAGGTARGRSHGRRRANAGHATTTDAHVRRTGWRHYYIVYMEKNGIEPD